MTPSSRFGILFTRGGMAFVLLVSLAYFWMGNGNHQLWDRDEPRYAVATREMVETNDWVIPHFNSGIRYDKPVFIYWMMAVPMKILGPTDFAARAAAGVAAALNVLLLMVLARRLGANETGAAIAALMGVAMLMLGLIGKAATTDAWLVLTVLAPVVLRWEQLHSGFAWWRHVVFWAILGVSLILKGPVGPTFVGAAIIVERAWSWWMQRRTGHNEGFDIPGAGVQFVRTGLGIVVLLAVSLPWGIAAWKATDGGFFLESVGTHVVGRAMQPINHHQGIPFVPWLTYIPALPLVVFPFTAAVLVAMWWGFCNRHLRAVRFLWSWFVPGFVIISAVSTRLPHYLAPLLGSLVAMTALWWTHAPDFRGPGWLWKGGAFFTAFLFVMLGIGAPVAMSILGLAPVMAPMIVVGFLFVGAGVWGCVEWLRLRPGRGVAAWSGGLVAGLLVVLLWALPALDPLRPSRVMAEWVRENGPPGTSLLAIDYKEPSLVFYWQGYVEMTRHADREQTLARLASDEPVAVVTSRPHWERWLGELAAEDPPVAMPDNVRVAFDREYFLFQRGRFRNLVIVTNF